MRRLPPALLTMAALALAFTLRSVAADLVKYKCLERFAKNETREFEDCRRKPCFIFLSEEPYVRLDRSMETDAHTKLFPCNNPRKEFPLLRGSAFNVMALTAVGDGAFCVWGGPNCRFNGMVDFIDAAADERPGYRFGATGLLLENRKRLRANVAQSVSLAQEELGIFGPLMDTRDTFPFHRLVRPFRALAWASFAVFLAAILAGAWLTSCAFGGCSLSPRRAFHFFMDPRDAVCGTAPLFSMQESLDNSPAELHRLHMRRRTDRMSAFNVANNLLRLSLGSMLVIFLLFYELAVVNFLFIEQSRPNVRDVRSLPRAELGRYAVEEKAGTEDVWHSAVYTPGKFPPDQPPWRRCPNLSVCFDWALDPNDEVQFVVGFKSAGHFQVRKRNICKNITDYGTERKLFSFGTGWLYGRHIPIPFQRKVDTQILTMHEKEQLPELLEADSSPLYTGSCSPLIQNIDVGVIGASVVVLVLPPMLLILFMVVYFCVQVRRNGIFLHNNRRKSSENTAGADASTTPKTSAPDAFSTGSTWNTASDQRQQYA